MRRGVKLRGIWACLLCFCFTWPAHAQLGPGAQPAHATGPAVERYRDGTRWLHVEREPARAGERAWINVSRADGAPRPFRAQVDEHAIVQLAPELTLERLLEREQLRLVRSLSQAARLYLVAADSGEDGLRIASRLAAAAGVVEALPDLHVARVRHGVSLPPNDPQYGAQWYLKKLGMEKAWRHVTGDPDTIVVVIDDGCDLQHPDLKENLLGGADLVDGDDDPSYAPRAKNNNHGTACSGLIAARADNGVGIAGVCPECSLRCVRLLPAGNELVPISRDIAAFDYALRIGAAVVSNSWGFGENMAVPVALRNLIARLFTDGRDGKGTLVLFSAGNEDRELQQDEIDGVSGVLSIGAINNFDEAAPFSNFGESLDLTAPAGTYTTDISGADGDNSGDYTSLFGGTSSACPVAAGVAALVMSARKDMTASDVSELLLQTARKAPFARPDGAGHDRTYGYGIVDPVAAVRRALDITEPEPETPPDAGAPRNAGGPSGAKTTEREDSGCGVAAADGGVRSAPVALWLLALAWLASRKRPRC